MTRDEIAAFFPAPGRAPDFGAMNYAVPTLAWLQGPLWDFFKARLWNENLDKWQTRWECRDFTLMYMAAARECWALTPGNDTSDAPAVGDIWFRPYWLDPTQPGHSIAPVFTENGLQFIDPQNNTLWPMSPGQFSSRYFLRF